MAKRESQGLQIALILLVMLTVILCIATYFFWSQGEKLKTQLASAKEAAATADTNRNQMIDQNIRLKQLIGHGEQDDMSDIDNAYQQTMLLYGQSVPEGERNYRGLPEHLVNVIQERNKQINELSANERKLKNDQKATVEKLEKQLADTMAEWNQAKQDAEKWRAEFGKTQQDLEGKVAAAEKAYASAQRKLVTEKNKLREQLNETSNNEETLLTRVGDLEKKLTSIQRKTFETADGKITFVNQSSRFVYINLGRTDALQRQVTFSVYDVDENNLARAEPKGSIEVTRLLGDHLAEARILDDAVTDPIISGDLIYSPIWQPGQPVRFALAGLLDVDRDGVDDRDLIRNLISLNGGKVDADLSASGQRSGQLSIETRYLVLGKVESRNEAATRALRDLRQEAKTFGATEVPLERFLADMGYQSVGRTLTAGPDAEASDYRTKPYREGTGRFRPRKPPVRKLDATLEE